MNAEFVDTNIILYLLDDGQKADRAETLLSARPTISVQVLNELTVNCRRKAGMSWDETGAFVTGIATLCTTVPITQEVHVVGRALAERYQLSVYDAMIVSAALLSGCSTLWSEDMHDGLLIENQLRVRNPFTGSSGSG